MRCFVFPILVSILAPIAAGCNARQPIGSTTRDVHYALAEDTPFSGPPQSIASAKNLIHRLAALTLNFRLLTADQRRSEAAAIYDTTPQIFPEKLIEYGVTKTGSAQDFVNLLLAINEKFGDQSHLSIKICEVFVRTEPDGTISVYMPNLISIHNASSGQLLKRENHIEYFFARKSGDGTLKITNHDFTDDNLPDLESCEQVQHLPMLARYR